MTVAHTVGDALSEHVTDSGSHPELHVNYNHDKIKQYHKEGRALRTETTVTDSRDFGETVVQPARPGRSRLPPPTAFCSTSSVTPLTPL